MSRDGVYGIGIRWHKDSMRWQRDHMGLSLSESLGRYMGSIGRAFVACVGLCEWCLWGFKQAVCIKCYTRLYVGLFAKEIDSESDSE